MTSLTTPKVKDLPFWVTFLLFVDMALVYVLWNLSPLSGAILTVSVTALLDRFLREYQVATYLRYVVRPHIMLLLYGSWTLSPLVGAIFTIPVLIWGLYLASEYKGVKTTWLRYHPTFCLVETRSSLALTYRGKVFVLMGVDVKQVHIDEEAYRCDIVNKTLPPVRFGTPKGRILPLLRLDGDLLETPQLIILRYKGNPLVEIDTLGRTVTNFI